MGAQPGAQQRPEPFDGVDMALMEPVAILIAGILTSTVTHCAMPIAPFDQSVIDIKFIGIDLGAGPDRGAHQRCDGHLPDVLQHPDRDLATTLEQP